MSFGVGLELAEAVDEVGAGHRVAADADAGRHTDAELLQLVQRLIGQRAGSRHDADVRAIGRWQLGDLSSGDTDVALPWADDARAVRAEQPGVGKVANQRVEDFGLVLGGNALGDADYEPDTGSGCFEDGSRCCLRRDRDERCRGSRCSNRLGDRVEHRDTFAVGGDDLLPTLAGGHATDDLCSVCLVAQPVVLALPAGKALHDDLGVRVDEDGHLSCSCWREPPQHELHPAWWVQT